MSAAQSRQWRREWMAAFAQLGKQEFLSLPVPRLGSPPEIDELRDALEVLRSMWSIKNIEFTHRHALGDREVIIESHDYRCHNVLRLAYVTTGIC